MKLIGTSESRPVPEEGQQPALLVHVEDMGPDLNDFDPKNIRVNTQTLKFFFLLAETIPEEWEGQPVSPEIAGKPFMLSTRNINVTFGDRGNLRKIVNGLLGSKAPKGPGELRNFDPTTLVPLPCSVGVRHYTRDDGSLGAGLEVDKIGGPIKGATLPDAPAKFEVPAWVPEAKAKQIERIKAAGLPVPGQGFDSVPFGILPFLLMPIAGALL